MLFKIAIFFMIFTKQMLSQEKIRPESKTTQNITELIAKRKATAKAIPKKLDPLEYYRIENLQNLKNQGKQIHVPCQIIIDQEGAESPKTTAIALTSALSVSLTAHQWPILVSASLMHNLLYKLEKISKGESIGKSENFLGETSFNKSDWEAYDVPNSQFILLLPKKYINFFSSAFKTNTLKSITDFLPENKEYLKFMDWLNEKIIYKPLFSKADLAQVFITVKESPSMPIIDFILDGHGGADRYLAIAGLGPREINNALSFFDTLNTGTVIILSCSAGGKNLDLLQFKDNINVTHNYLLIVGAISDEPIVKTSYIYIADDINSYQKCFNYSALLVDRGESLNRLLNALNISNFQPHGNAGIPQVWLPNGYGFQTYNIDKEILVLGNVYEKIFAEEKKPIIINNKKAVLIYPKHIRTNLKITPFQIPVGPAEYKSDNLKLRLEEKGNLWSKIPTLTEAAFWKNLTNAQISNLSVELNKYFPSFKIEDPEHYKSYNDNFLYPQFILMAREQKPDQYVCHFHEINLENQNCISCGVMRFIRDAFFGFQENPIEKTIFIDSITGFNDVALLAKAIQLKQDILGEPIMASLTYDNLTKNVPIITIKNVTIYLGSEYNTRIEFESYDTAWVVYNPLSDGWKFYEQGYKPDYKYKSENLVPVEESEQKSISEILKLKQIQMHKNKVEEKKVNSIHVKSKVKLARHSSSFTKGKKRSWLA